jgi:transcriptional regulator with XRE-family HTH domain
MVMTLLFGFAPSPDFAENLRNAMFIKGCKAVDVARATKITPSVISRYLTGAHQPSTDNLLVISKNTLDFSRSPFKLLRGSRIV